MSRGLKIPLVFNLKTDARCFSPTSSSLDDIHEARCTITCTLLLDKLFLRQCKPTSTVVYSTAA